MKKFTCKVKAFSIFLAGLILLVFTGCGSSTPANVQAGEAYWVEKGTWDTHEDWPVGTTVDLSIVSIKDTFGREVKVIRSAVNGSDSISGVPVKGMQLRLSQYGGGGEAGPIFFRDDGSLWTMMTRHDIKMQNFKKVDGGWESIAPLGWVCGGGGDIGPFSVSLVFESPEGETSFRLGIDKNYLTVGDGFTKYIPASHAPGVIISCQ